MQKINVLGIDPSLRNTGFSVISYDPETGKFDTPKNCTIVTNPQKYKGTDAILNMIDQIQELSTEICYMESIDKVIVESPAALFNPKFPASALISIAHISGACACLFGTQRTHLVRPVEWNRNRKKEKTSIETQKILGECETWNYIQKIKSQKHFEHIIDASGMAMWWINSYYAQQELEDLEEDD